MAYLSDDTYQIGYGLSTTSVQSKPPVVGLDLSRSNAIYGASNTVQPNAISLIPQIRY